jgi:hypothetical protein
MGEKRNVYRIFVGKPERKRPLWRISHRWVDNTVGCRAVFRQRLGKHFPEVTDTHAIIEVPLETMLTTRAVQRGYEKNNWSKNSSGVEAGSNTVTVNPWVISDDEKGGLKSEPVKDDHEWEKLRWRGPAAYTKDRTVLSSERAPHKTGP